MCFTRILIHSIILIIIKYNHWQISFRDELNYIFIPIPSHSKWVGGSCLIFDLGKKIQVPF